MRPTTRSFWPSLPPCLPPSARRGSCTLVFIDEDGTESVARPGTIEGLHRARAPQQQGFGYDPLFLPDEYGGMRALASRVSQAENGISHRGNALRVLKRPFPKALTNSKNGLCGAFSVGYYFDLLTYSILTPYGLMDTQAART